MSVYDRIRHQSAAEAAAGEPGAWDTGILEEHEYCLLVTYRRDGEPVPTPVWFGVDGDRVYARSEGSSFKVKRIRRDPRARVAPCTVRGKPKGPSMEGVARVLEASEEQERAERALAAHYGTGRRLYNRFVGEKEPTYIEIAPASPSDGRSA